MRIKQFISFIIFAVALIVLFAVELIIDFTKSHSGRVVMFWILIAAAGVIFINSYIGQDGHDQSVLWSLAQIAVALMLAVRVHPWNLATWLYWLGLFPDEAQLDNQPTPMGPDW